VLLCGIGQQTEYWCDLRVYTYEVDLNVRYAQHALSFSRPDNIPVNVTLPVVRAKVFNVPAPQPILPAVLLQSEADLV
jgi:hypothetical protein